MATSKFVCAIWETNAKYPPRNPPPSPPPPSISCSPYLMMAGCLLDELKPKVVAWYSHFDLLSPLKTQSKME